MEERELILKLGKKITDRIPVKLGMQKLTVEDPEYYGLAAVVTDEMAEVALAMEVRVPTTPEKIAEKLGRSPEYVEDMFNKMAMIGLLEFNWENPEHTKQWSLPRFIPGCAEYMNMHTEQAEAHPEIGDFFDQMGFLPLKRSRPWCLPEEQGSACMWFRLNRRSHPGRNRPAWNIFPTGWISTTGHMP